MMILQRPLFAITVVLFLTAPYIDASYIEKCLLNQTEGITKQYVTVSGNSVPVTLWVSRRPSHRIVTHIFKIFLQEVLEYPYVNIVEQENQMNVENIYTTIGVIGRSPDIMIDLEVWVSLQDDTEFYVEHFNVVERGSLGVSGRLGWFIPRSFMKRILIGDDYRTDDMIDVHWSFLKKKKFTAQFDLNINILKKFSVKTIEPLKYYCDESSCKDGIFIPRQCEENSTKCAVVLASHYEDTDFIIDHINKLNLYVKVVWVGPNLRNVYEFLMNRTTTPFFILGRTPGEVITPEKDFAAITFPNCIVTNSTESIGCKYEMNRLVKVAWPKLKLVAKPIYDALQVFAFTTEDYEEFFYQFNHKTEQEIACEWMRRNEKTFREWEPNPSITKIYIGGIFPLNGSKGGVSDTAYGIVNATRMAKIAINQSPLLHGYELNLVIFNGGCKSDCVMKAYIDYMRIAVGQTMVGVLGPACSETVEPLAGVSKLFNTIIISYSAEGVSFSDRKNYPFFFRTIGENKHFIPVYRSLFSRLRWKRIAALTEDGQKYTEYVSHLQNVLEDDNITFTSKKFPRERDTYIMKKYLEDLKNNRWKIIIADVIDDVARTVMCEAYKHNMTARHGYVWFLPLWLSETWYNTTHYNAINSETTDCTIEQMLEAIDGHLSLNHAYFAPNDSIMQENITVGEWRQKYANETSVQSNYAGYAYDAIWTYALALDKLVKEDPEGISTIHSDSTTIKLMKLIQETDFNGVSGRIKFFDGPSRYSIIHVIQRINNATKIIGSYYPDMSNHTVKVGELNMTSEIIWLSGKIPDDGTLPPTECAFGWLAKLLNVGCTPAIIIANVIGLMIVITILSLAVYLLKRRYDRKVLLTQKYMRSLGIDLLDTASIDKWEIQRDRVVINRKLGEGAFGTVYGGEALFDDRGWVGVAVKTLKIGSTTEEKLDFLSEAEIMKRFEHKNIVKLLGVCTQSEPVYTVMEFMLYGDLKTFLLARRHLVNVKNPEENDEISPKKLTSMALDVARALGYLAEMKFVHRDVACRNCLLNAQRMVKLGDFGMTRPMFENDYYKFNRKGMLPVRWMAPESLSLGVFTPSSDVWSYGVLLYEIITFGSFPFQGMSNYQVLEHVKEGNVLKIPSGVKFQLEELIKSCWNLEPKRRPQASVIVEFLANNPRLLSPCLDAPLSSVQIEEIDHEIEMRLPESFRKFPIEQNSPIEPLIDTSDIESIPLEPACVKEPLLSAQYKNENEQNSKQNGDDDYLDTDAYGVHAVSLF